MRQRLVRQSAFDLRQEVIDAVTFAHVAAVVAIAHLAKVRVEVLGRYTSQRRSDLLGDFVNEIGH